MPIMRLAQFWVWCIHHFRSRWPQECVHDVINNSLWVRIRCGLLLLDFAILRRQYFSLVSNIKSGLLEISSVQAYITMGNLHSKNVEEWHAIAVFNLMWEWRNNWSMLGPQPSDGSNHPPPTDSGITVRFLRGDEQAQAENSPFAHNDWDLSSSLAAAVTAMVFHSFLICYSKLHSLVWKSSYASISNTAQ